MSSAGLGRELDDQEELEVAVVLEERYERTPDGRVWTRSPTSYSFWLRYLEVFRAVRVVARVRDVSRVPPDWREVTGPGVACTAIPYYIGPRGYLKRWVSVQLALRAAVPQEAAVILRASSNLGSAVAKRLMRAGRPYAVEVVADPWDVFAPGAVSHPFRALFRRRFASRLARECARAVAVSYVTRQTLQVRYPVGPGALSVGCSDVELTSEAFAAEPRGESSNSPLVLIGVGSLEQRYKGFDVLIKALALARHEGLDLRLEILGAGRHLAELQAEAVAEGLGDHVDFRGWVASREDLLRHLDRADIFVLSSRAEGLPRALVEAMARALPCLGTRVGGVPELLAPECLVSPDDPVALARSIASLARSPERRAAESRRNWEKAKAEFHEDVLSERRVGYYRLVRERTLAWLKRRPRPEVR